MILMTMTADEIASQLKRTPAGLDKVMTEQEAQWKRTVKKYPWSRYRVIEMHSNTQCQDYLRVLTHLGNDKNRGIHHYSLAKVYDGKRMNYIGSFAGRSLVAIYSTHFFERYRERTNRPELTIEQAIGEFMVECPYMSDIYDDNNGRIVYAIPDGICLCEYTTGKCTKIYFRTFVSLDMLKDTQLQAWSQVRDDLLKLKEHSERYLDSDKWWKKKNDICDSTMGSLNRREADAIYSQYFNN